MKIGIRNVHVLDRPCMPRREIKYETCDDLSAVGHAVVVGS